MKFPPLGGTPYLRRRSRRFPNILHEVVLGFETCLAREAISYSFPLGPQQSRNAGCSILKYDLVFCPSKLPIPLNQVCTLSCRGTSFSPRASAPKNHASKLGATRDTCLLSEKYQFFTPGLSMGLLVSLLMLSILFVGIKAISSLEVTYAAFEKDIGPGRKTSSVR